MATATLTSKGQVTIPKEIREFLRLSSGDRLYFSVNVEGSVVLSRAAADVRNLRGLLYKRGRTAVTLEEMDRAIASGAARKQK